MPVSLSQKQTLTCGLLCRPLCYPKSPGCTLERVKIPQGPHPMLAHLRSIWFAIKASYWFYPALFAISGFLLALFLVYLDRTGATGWLNNVTWFHPTHPQGASNILTVLAASMIGVASTVFSITIAAVAYASGTYGPRLLTNFMEDKGNQLSLATFIGIFVYAIAVLRTVRAREEAATGLTGFVPQLSLLVGFGLMLLAVGVLVYFLHHIPSSIRINVVLEGIGRGLLDKITRRFPDSNSGQSRRRAVPSGRPVTSTSTGYIRYIELDELSEIAKRAGVEIGLALRTGDFVHSRRPLAWIDSECVPDDVADDVRACFALGGSRTPEQDLEFSIDELVEIALRALSPGINDPFTAITAIHWLGAAIAELGRRELRHKFLNDDDARVVPLADDFEHFIRRGFGAMRIALANSKIAALVAFDVIGEAAAQIDDSSRVTLLVEEGDLLMAQAEVSLKGPELQEIRSRHALFRAHLAA